MECSPERVTVCTEAAGEIQTFIWSRFSVVRDQIIWLQCVFLPLAWRVAETQMQFYMGYLAESTSGCDVSGLSEPVLHPPSTKSCQRSQISILAWLLAHVGQIFLVPLPMLFFQLLLGGGHQLMCCRWGTFRKWCCCSGVNLHPLGDTALLLVVFQD